MPANSHLTRGQWQAASFVLLLLSINDRNVSVAMVMMWGTTSCLLVSPCWLLRECFHRGSDDVEDVYMDRNAGKSGSFVRHKHYLHESRNYSLIDTVLIYLEDWRNYNFSDRPYHYLFRQVKKLKLSLSSAIKVSWKLLQMKYLCGIFRSLKTVIKRYFFNKILTEGMSFAMMQM